MTYEEKLIREYHKQKYREEVNSGHYSYKTQNNAFICHFFIISGNQLKTTNHFARLLFYSGFLANLRVTPPSALSGIVPGSGCLQLPSVFSASEFLQSIAAVFCPIILFFSARIPAQIFAGLCIPALFQRREWAS